VRLLKAIRSVARPRLGTLRRTILSTLGMAAIVVGLLAMHSSGADHAAVAELPAATATTAHSAHAGHTVVPIAETAMAAATATATAFVSAATSAVQCDDACMHGVLDCALMVMTCAMLLAVAALIVFARRPGLYRKLHDTGARIVALLPRIPLPVHRPDLIVLSISRT
jgi:hypothetical protein